MSGAINMLDHPEFSDPATMRPLLRTFEDKARLIDLLSQMAGERGVQVMIGSENPVDEMRECSLIASTYTYRDQVLGVLGVVGPAAPAVLRRHLHRGRDGPAGVELAVAGQAAALPAVLELFSTGSWRSRARSSAILSHVMSDETEWAEGNGRRAGGGDPAASGRARGQGAGGRGTPRPGLAGDGGARQCQKRAAREREDYTRYANESLLREILPVLDNFERALQAAKGEPAAAAVTAGVELIQRELLRVLEKFGVTSFDSVGQPFDPTRHEAVARVSAPGQPEMTVVGETARGYMLHGRVLRPAMVTVAMGDSGSAGQANGAAA